MSRPPIATRVASLSVSIIATSSPVASRASRTNSRNRTAIEIIGAEPTLGEHERAFDERDRLAHVMERGREERLAQCLDPIRQGREADRGGAIERVADDLDPEHHVGRRSVPVEQGRKRPRDLQAEEAEFRHDRDRPKALLEAGLRVRGRRRADLGVVEGNRR